MELHDYYQAIQALLPSAEACAAYAGAASAFFAAMTIRSNSKARKNERLLSDSVRTLERSFLALVGPNDSGGIPPNDRLGWLTSARLIEQYRDSKQEITDRIVLKECESHEEHWRHQFYLRLKNLAGGSLNYYENGGGVNCIDKVSAVVVHSFADWDDDKKDPLSKYKDAGEAVKKLKPLQRWFVLHKYCETLL